MSTATSAPHDGTTLRLDEIVRDGKLRVRVNLTKRYIDQYRKHIDALPPVLIYEINGKLYLVDGFHRFEAFRREDRDCIPVQIVQGKTWPDALRDAALINSSSERGLDLGYRDKTRALGMLWHAGSDWDDGLLAQKLGMDPRDVTKDRLRREKLPENHVEHIPYLRRLLGQDGKYRPRHYRDQHDAIRRAKAADPKRPDRSIARELECSPSTVSAALSEKAGVSSKKVGQSGESEEADEVAAREINPRFEYLREHADPYDPKAIRGKLIHGDALALLRQEDRDKYDAIVTDPPYGVGAGPGDAWESPAHFAAFTHAWLELALPLLKPTGQLLVCWPAQWLDVLWGIVDEINQRLGLGLTRGMPIIWDHPDIIWRTFSDKIIKCTYDAIVHYYGEASHLHHTRLYSGSPLRQAVWHVERQRPCMHLNEKPIELMQRLVDIATMPGEIVLDPFVGCGTTAVACERTGRRWVAYELEEEFVEKARLRIMLEAVQWRRDQGSVQEGDAR